MRVIETTYLANYRIYVHIRTIEGDYAKVCDIKPILIRSHNPDIKELLDPDKFKQFHIEHGGICWNNNALSLSAQSLWDGSYLNTT